MEVLRREQASRMVGTRVSSKNITSSVKPSWTTTYPTPALADCPTNVLEMCEQPPASKFILGSHFDMWSFYMIDLSLIHCVTSSRLCLSVHSFAHLHKGDGLAEEVP